MSFIANITDALLYRDFLKSDERHVDQDKSYEILGGGTIDVNNEALQHRLESIDDELLNAVIEKKQYIKKANRKL